MPIARVHLVRHGRAAAGWGDEADPGLDDLGRAQAVGVADELAGLGPIPVVTSPLRRARETATPLSTRWDVEAVVEPAFGEIPSPTPDLAERSAWLHDAMRSRWVDLGADVIAWRNAVIATVLALRTDAVVFTHFVAINAIAAAASGDEALIVFAPGNASHTVIETNGGTLSIVGRGAEAATDVG